MLKKWKLAKGVFDIKDARMHRDNGGYKLGKVWEAAKWYIFMFGFWLLKNLITISYGQKVKTSQSECWRQWMHHFKGLTGDKSCATFVKFPLLRGCIVLCLGFRPIKNLILISYGHKVETSKSECLIQWMHQCLGIMGARSCAKFGKFPLLRGCIVLCLGFRLMKNLILISYGHKVETSKSKCLRQ